MDTPEQSEVFDSIENKADFLLNQLPEDRMKYLKKWRAMFEPEFVDAVREKLMEKLGLQELNHEQSCVCISCQAKETALGSL